MDKFLKSLIGNGVGSAYDSFISNYKKKTGQVSSTPDIPTPQSATPIPKTNVGATSTIGTPSPAKTAYVGSLAKTIPTVSTPPVVQNQPITGDTTTPSGAVVNATTGSTVSTPPVDPNASYRSDFDTYIQSLKPSDAETTATKNLTDLQLADKKAQADAIYRNGGTIGSAGTEANNISRNNSFGIDAASNTLNALTGARTATTNAAKARVDFEKSLQGDTKPFEVGDNTLQYNPATGKYDTIATKSAAGSSAGFTLSPGENRYDASGKLIASGGPKPLTQAQETAQIANTEKEKAAQQSATQSIGLINGLLNGDRYKSISGPLQTGSIPFIGDRAAVNEYDQLQGLLKLGIRGLLKGQGAVSDYEGKILGQAASSLSRLSSESEVKSALQKIRGVIQTNNGGEANVIIKDKNGKVLGQGSLTGQDIYEAVNDGNTVEYQ